MGLNRTALLVLAVLMMAAGAFVARMTWEFVPRASAQEEDLDCSDFDSQAAAQEELERALTDPNGLDPDADGEACEEYTYPEDEATTQFETTRSIPGETTTQYQPPPLVTVAEPTVDEPPLYVSGGPGDGPAPPMPDGGGGCPPEYPLEEDGGCWR